VKARLRESFHPQVRSQVGPAISRPERFITDYGGQHFLCAARADRCTAVELDVLLLTPPTVKVGDADNRLKTVIDGLTRPANPEQMRGFAAPADGGPTFCLLDDDALVQRVNLDSRKWHGATGPDNTLVVVTASMVMLEGASTGGTSLDGMFMLM
jgi:hypothetical protein